MKGLVLAITFGLVAGTPPQSTRVPDRDHDGLTGHVRTIRIERAKLSGCRDKIVEGQRFLSAVLTYDESGDLVRQSLYVDGRPQSVLECRYTPAGDHIERSYSSSRATIFSLVATNDTADDVALGTGWSHESRNLQVRYDALGRRLETVQTDEAGVPLVNGYRERFEYDEVGRLSAVSRFSSRDGSLRRQLAYQYGVDGMVSSMLQYGATGDIEKRWCFRDYSVDRFGNWIERTETQEIPGSPRHQSYRIYRTITYFGSQVARARIEDSLSVSKVDDDVTEASDAERPSRGKAASAPIARRVTHEPGWNKRGSETPSLVESANVALLGVQVAKSDCAGRFNKKKGVGPLLAPKAPPAKDADTEVEEAAERVVERNHRKVGDERRVVKTER